MHIVVFKYSKEEGNNLWGFYKNVLKGSICSTWKSLLKVLLACVIVQTDKQIRKQCGLSSGRLDLEAAGSQALLEFSALPHI